MLDLPPRPGVHGVGENKQPVSQKRCLQIKALSSTALRRRAQEEVSRGGWGSDQGVTQQYDVKSTGKRGPY